MGSSHLGFDELITQIISFSKLFIFMLVVTPLVSREGVKNSLKSQKKVYIKLP